MGSAGEREGGEAHGRREENITAPKPCNITTGVLFGEEEVVVGVIENMFRKRLGVDKVT